MRGVMRDLTMFLLVCFIALMLGCVFAYVARANDGMVSLLERHFQIMPGSTRVLPECGCTVRYLGTSVHGRRYTVVLEKLD